MIYIVILMLILISIKPLNFAKYNWGKKQRLQAVGVVFIVMLMLALPVYVLMTR